MDPPGTDLETLHDACEEGDIDSARRVCAANPALLTRRDDDGQTCLHHACSGGDLEMVRAVVDALGPGAVGCNERDDHDMTPFHLACECGHLPVVVRAHDQSSPTLATAPLFRKADIRILRILSPSTPPPSTSPPRPILPGIRSIHRRST